MESMQQFLDQLPSFTGVFMLMLSTFLIGYFAAFWLQKQKDRKLINRLKKEVNTLRAADQKVRDIETIFTEIKPKIIKVVKETQEEINETPVVVEEVSNIPLRNKTSYVNYTRSVPELDFNRFGYGSEQSRDDLTQIEGIGPYIEEKLFEIGIYNFDQISKFKEADIRIITELIDFFPGRIERDNWVQQASGLMVN
jgi:predicted flap endonuclease-1-like 5' DNA nuclease